MSILSQASRSVFVSCCLFVAAAPAGAQITSTVAGGSWLESSTWIGGAVPGAADDVVINGPVLVRFGDACRNLTVNVGGRIRDVAGASFTEELTVGGDAINRGVVEHSANEQLRIRVRGSLHNEGTWAPNATHLDGAGDQALSVGGGAAFAGEFHLFNPAVRASSELRFSAGRFDLNGNRLEMQGFGLVTDETFYFFDGVISGPVTLLGTFQSISGGLSLEGDVTNRGVVESHPSGAFTDVLPVKGRLENRGTIRNGEARQFLLEIDGEAINRGSWNVFETRFMGEQDQRLSHEAGAPLSGGWTAAGAGVTVEAAGSLTFAGARIDLNGGTLRMGEHALLLDQASTLYDGLVDARSLTMSGNSTLGGSLRVAPEVTLRGAVQAFSGTVFEGLTVVADTLRDAPGGGFRETVEVRGRLRNEGVIQGELVLNTYADLVNSGTWINHSTVLLGSAPQQLSVENAAPFGGRFLNEAGTATAYSNLHFSGGYFDLRRKRLEMSGFELSTDESFYFIDGVISGPVILLGTFQSISGGLSLEGDVTNQGVVESHPSGAFTDVLPVKGRLENRGTIRDGEARRFLLEIDGEAINRGSWNVFETRFTGEQDQRLSHEAGAPLSGGWTAAGAGVTVEAAGALTFAGARIDLNGGTLRMGAHALLLDQASSLYDGLVDVRSLTMSGNSTLGPSLRVAPEVTLRGAVQAFSGTVFEGLTVVADTLRDAPGGGFRETVEVRGRLRNEGVIQGELVLNTYADLVNSGTWINHSTVLLGRGRRSVRGNPLGSFVSAAGEEVVLAGEVFLTALSIGADALARVDGGSSLHLPAGGLTGTVSNFANFGRVVMHRVPVPNQTTAFYDASVRMPGAFDFDTLFVETFGNQVPGTFTAAVRNWWRLRTNSPSMNSLTSLTLSYNDQQLGSNEESALEVFLSTDGGETWEQISTSLNLTRDANLNRITIQNVPVNGDLLLSSSADPVSVIPNVIVSITGRPNIRIGAPNRYMVHYVNNSDQPTGAMLMALRIDPGAHIQRIEPSTAHGLKVRPFEPEDLFVPGAVGDSVAFLYVESMNPREERTLIVVATGGLELGKQYDSQAEPVTLTAAVLVLGTAILVDYLQDVATNYLEELTASEFYEAFEAAVDRTNEEWFGAFEKPGESIVLVSLEAASKRILGVVALPFSLIKLFSYDVWVALFRGGERFLANPNSRGCRLGPPRRANKFFVGGPADHIAEGCPAVYGTSVSLEPVRSWDPNEKLGPAGAGPEGFITSAGKMNYTILFENKAEATAEAYRIVVHDTLSGVFDWESIDFGETSHEGFTMSRDGNVLRWEIEGIELPPNVTPPEGEGFVSFSVRTMDDLPSGTRIENRSTIVFDLNPDITTNTVVNTLDFTPPVTSMRELAGETHAGEVVVRWDSDDGEAGSGVGQVNVYASIDGAGFHLAGSSTTDSLVVPVERDGTYSFYALAVDNVGNAETVRPELIGTRVFVPVGTEVAEVPAQFDLEQNFPNPFNPSTTISYSVPDHRLTVLRVYDVLGRRIATLVHEAQPPGRYQVDWDAGRLGSGLYFYRLQQGDHTSTRRMILIK